MRESIVSRPRILLVALTAAAVAVSGLAVPNGNQNARAAAPAASYTYDADGRLSTVTTSAGTATYHYDAVGNLLSITRSGGAARAAAPSTAPRAAKPTITSVSPLRTKPGATISVHGSGFSAVAADNQVRLGALLMQVTRASATSLTALVPPAAPSGRISITNAAGRAVSADKIVVVLPGPHAPRVHELPPLHAPDGITAVSGRVLRSTDGAPLAGVELTVAGVTTHSDVTGRFLLAGLPSGQQVLSINGNGVHGADYGTYENAVPVEAGRTTALYWKTWLTPLDTAHEVTLPSRTTRPLTITTPLVPGLEVHLPAHSTVRDEDGRAVHRVGITEIPVERPPFPLPPGVDTPVYFTVQPGGAYIAPRGATIVYPNTQGLKPGAHLDFWNYDPAEGWYVYGKGTVTRDGRQIVPDKGVSVYEFTGAMFNGSGLSPAGNGPDDGSGDGDPVNLATGLFDYSQTDLTVSDVMPLDLTRTYRQNDPYSRRYGIGADDPYGMFLWSANQYQEVDLILPGSQRVHFVRTSPGTGWTDAVFEPQTRLADFAGAVMDYNGNGWDLTLKNGTVWVFGENAPLQAFRDRWGNTVTLTRTAGQRGDITRVTSPHGRWIGYTYDASGRVVKAQDNIGRAVNYTYDATGHLATVTNAAGGVTTYGYDTSGRMTTLEDARGITFLTNTYDATTGRVIRQETPDGGVFTFAYSTDGSGKVVQTDVTSPRGYVHRVQFDTAGHTISDTQAAGTGLAETTTYERDAAERVSAMVDPAGRRTEYTYDANGDPETVTTQAGTAKAATTSFSYEPRYSRPASITDPLGHTTTWSYDDVEGTVTETDPVGRTVTTTISQGQPVSIADKAGNTSYFSYIDGDLVATSDPLDRVTTRYTDAAGRVIRVTDPAGGTTRIAYDARSLPTTITDPQGGITTRAYDADGNVRTTTDANNHTVTYTYDVMNRVKTRTNAVGGKDTYTYDLGGNVKSYLDPTGLTDAFTYDALDRLTKASLDKPQGGVYASTVTRTFDTANRLKQVTDSLAGAMSWQYDTADRTTKVTTPRGSVSYTYDLAGRRVSMTADAAPTVRYAYNTANDITSVTQGTATARYGYDTIGRRAKITLPNGVAETYRYDLASELTGMTVAKGTTSLGSLTYGYDAAGRVSSLNGSLAAVDLPAAVSTSTYDAANRPTTFDGAAVTTDAAGRVTSVGSATYTWNSRGQLTGVSAGAVAASFSYDASGNRLSRTVNGAKTGYLNDGDEVVQEQDAAGTRTADTLRGPGQDEILARTIAGGASDAVVSDRLGSSLRLTDASGAVTTSYSYTPFGAPTATGAASSNAFQYTGLENDGTGLQYNRARYYSPTLQRFLSEDPAGSAGGDVNLYAYVGNSPLNARDPSGMFLDTLLDIGFIAYDIYKLATDGRKNLGTNLAALGLDVLGAAVPFATGLGAAERAAAHAGDAAHLLPEALTVGHNAEEGVHVYQGYRDGENVYSGITNNFERRQAQHGDRFTMEQLTGEEGLTRGEARAVEQALIVRNKGENKINSISPNQPYYQQAVDWGEAWLQAHGY